jgi:receptor protein-tyrosine kinase/non-specific protein-tyrosine kinase
MSRIEKALEKATRLRNKTSSGAVSETLAVREDTLDVTKVSSYIITLTDPTSPISEEYRKLKSMVVRLTKQEGFKNTIMVTSTLSKEGKSITAINLAITLSQEYDYTVLLIDADLRDPSLHRYLNLTPEAGLTDCLVDGLDISRALLKPGIGKLSFLPSGKKVKNPVELLASQRMKELIDEIKHRYSDRYIIIDTPPTLPFAETRSISALVDGIVFVVKEGVASLQNISDALEILKDHNILGIVYNDVGIESLEGRYHYYYPYSQHANTKEGA